jgi:hypothetical protein
MFTTPSSSQPPAASLAPGSSVQFVTSQHSGGFGEAMVALLATGMALIGGLVAMVSFLLAAVSFDGATLFGCSDGTKYPDPAKGAACIAFGIAALVVGFGVAGLLGRGLQNS